MNELLERIVADCRHYTSQGHVATYIPELANGDPSAIGICIVSQGREMAFAGDYQARFTMQSVVKPIILLQALMDSGPDRVRGLVGVEATGKPFDAFNHAILRLYVTARAVKDKVDVLFKTHHLVKKRIPRAVISRWVTMHIFELELLHDARFLQISHTCAGT